MVAAFLTSTIAAKAQVTVRVFVDPHPVVSGGTIGLAFAGDKFVGTTQGDGIGILYSTDLTGSNTRLFAPSVSIPGGDVQGEHVVTSSLGLGGFPLHDIYVAAGNGILYITNDGSKSSMFCTGLSGPVRGMLFDGVGTFGHELLVTTNGGDLYRVNSAGRATLVASIGDDIEGMDIAPFGAGFGAFDGKLIVAGERSGLIQAVNQNGEITIVTENRFDTPERASFVPLNLGASGSSLEGLYAANYPRNVLKGDATQFAAYKGDLIVTTELDHRISRVHWSGSSFEITVIGALTGQAEDGFFLSPAMLNAGGSCPPEEDMGKQRGDEWCWPHCRKTHPRQPKRADEATPSDFGATPTATLR
jgi:hypothetical protein